MILKYKVIDNKYCNIKEVLKSYFSISDRLLTKLKKNNKIYLNNKVTYVNCKIKIEDLISIDLNFNEKSNNIFPTKMNLDILFEDDSFLIINKPFNIPVHPSILHFNNSLSNGVQYYFEENNITTKIRPVNRLDKDTSGIVIFAKNEYIQECLIRQMKNNIFKKEYYAILEGHIQNASQTINAPIARKAGSIIEREVNDNGTISITHINLIKNFKVNFNKFSFVHITLETGRTHQIRVHSKYICHPILGDTLYGNPSNLISRQALHAYKVTFIHPITKKHIIIEACLPNDMKSILDSTI